MASIFSGTDTEYTTLENSYRDHPTDNFEYWNRSDEIPNISAQPAIEKKKSIPSPRLLGLSIGDSILARKDKFKGFSDLLLLNKPIFDLLNSVEMKPGGMTLFLPLNLSIDSKLKAFELNKKNYGERFAILKLRDFLMSYIVGVVIYPEQINKRKLRIDTMNKSNNITIDKHTILDRFQMDPLGPSNVGNSVKYAIKCSNGIIYVINREILPLIDNGLI